MAGNQLSTLLCNIYHYRSYHPMVLNWIVLVIHSINSQHKFIIKLHNSIL